MCKTCGCSDESNPRLTDLRSGVTIPLDAGGGSEHSHPTDGMIEDSQHHEHPHGHHHHDGRLTTTIRLEAEILARNDRLAGRNRLWLADREILALNLISAPGAGKTTLLERTIGDLARERSVSVIEGDQETINDAMRIRATGCPVVQINTGAGCHLDATMVARGLQRLDPPNGSLVFIENVGNLVCPALFDLGERAKVVIVSVTEGDDKPLKYPHIFRKSDVMILNTIDLLPYVPFDVDRCLEHARRINPAIHVFPISALRGDGLGDWYDWLRDQRSPRVSLA